MSKSIPTTNVKVYVKDTTGKFGTPATLDKLLSTDATQGASLGTDGLILAPKDTVTTITGALTTGHTIGTYTNEAGTAVVLKETTTSLAITDQVLNYTDETGTVTNIDLAAAETLTTVTNTVTGHKIATYNDEQAGTTDINETVTAYTDAVAGTKHKIGSYKDEAGNSADVNETLTSIALNATTKALEYVDEAGTTTSLDLLALEHITAYADSTAAPNQHKIGTYTNEAGTVKDVNETVTAIGTVSFNALTGELSVPYTDEAGVTTTRKVVIPFDRYKTTATDCLDIQTGQVSLTVDVGLSYTPEQDVILYHDATNHMYGQVVSYDAATGALVVDVDSVEGAGNYCAWTVNLDAISVAAAETTTTMTNVQATGHLIGTYTNEDAGVVDIKETITLYTDAVAGTKHKIGTYANEAGTATDINETVTTLDEVSVSGSTLTVKYTGENGTQVTKTATLPADVLTSVTNLLAAGNRIASYTDELGATKDILETTTTFSGALATGHTIGTYTNEDGTAVVVKETDTTLTGVLSAGHTIGTYNSESGTATVIKETVTTVTNALASSATREKVGTYTNEDGTAVDLYAAKPLDVLTTAQTTPTATGNTTNLNTVFKDGSGDTWIVDSNGDAVKAGSTSTPETTTYNTAAPSSTTGYVAGDTWYVTPLGTQADSANATAEYRFDGVKWVKTPGAVTTRSTTSLTAMTYTAGAYANAKANAAATVADVLKLSDGSYVNNEDKITWTGHGLTVGAWYFLDPTTAGGYTTTPPAAPNLVQRLFFVEDANIIKVNVQEAIATDAPASALGEYLHIANSFSQNVSTSGTIHSFNVTVSGSSPTGAVTASGTGGITLKAGNRYRIEASCGYAFSSAIGLAILTQIFAGAAGVSNIATYLPEGNNWPSSGTRTMIAYVSPTVDTTYTVKTFAVVGTGTVRFNNGNGDSYFAAHCIGKQ